MSAQAFKDDGSLLDDTRGWNIIYPLPITINQEAIDLVVI
jgi:hypothetical protein